MMRRWALETVTREATRACDRSPVVLLKDFSLDEVSEDFERQVACQLGGTTRAISFAIEQRRRAGRTVTAETATSSSSERFVMAEGLQAADQARWTSTYVEDEPDFFQLRSRTQP